MAESEVEPAVEDSRGVCVILDLVTNDNGWEILKSEIQNACSVFKKLNYAVKRVKPGSREDIESKLNDIKNSLVSQHDSLVFLLVGKLKKPDLENAEEMTEYEEQQQTLKNYFETFNRCEILDNRPKIFLGHFIETVTDDEIEASPPSEPNKIVVTSTISGAEQKVKDSRSLFLESLVEVLTRFSHQCHVIELMTRITTEVEIRQFQLTEKKESAEKDDVFQMVVFEAKTQGIFKFVSEPIVNLATMPPVRVIQLPRSKELKRNLHFEIMRDLKDEHRYKMTKNPRGFCVLVNISNNRAGARLDDIRMKNLFEELMFTVTVICNKQHAEIEAELSKIAKDIDKNGNTFREHQAIFVILMAHGDKQGNTHVFVDIQGNTAPSKYIFEAFDGDNCKALIRVPKVFIIQTCMGGLRMRGTGSTDLAETSLTLNDEEGIEFYRAEVANTGDLTDGNMGNREAPHRMSDTYIFHSTVSGHKSYRSPAKGSYMIQALDDIIRDHSASKDVQQLFQLVSKQVTKGPVMEYERPTLKRVPAWQQPTFEKGTMNNLLYLNPAFQEGAKTNLYNTDAKEMSFTGTTIWFTHDHQSCLVVDVVKSDIKQVDLAATETTTIFRSNEGLNFGRIRRGVALGATRHLFLIETFTGKTFNEKDSFACIVIFDPSTETWKAELKLPFLNLISICEVYRDGVGFLSKDSEGGHMLSIHSRDAIEPGKSRARVQLQHGPSSTKDLLSVVDDSILFFNYTESVIVECELNGHVKRRIECHLSSSVRSIEAGTLYQPCVVTKDNNGDIVVICCTGIHTNANGAWSVDTKHSGVQHVCHNSQYTVFAFEEQIDTSTAPLVPVTQYGVKPADRVVTLTEEYWRIWSTSASEVVAVGGKNMTFVSLISKGGVVIHTQNLGISGRINSGLCLHGMHHGIIIQNCNSYTLIIAIVNHVSKTITIACEPFGIVKPVSLININQELFGVLCNASDNTESYIHLVDRITYERKKTVSLGFDTIGNDDTACMDFEGFFYVCSYQDNCVRMYDQQGKLTHKLGSKAEKHEADIPGEWLGPCTVLVDVENCLLVQCLDGSDHRYKQNTWEILPRFLQWTLNIMYYGREIYSVCNKYLCVNKIMEQEHTSEDNTDVSAAACPVITGAPKHISTTQLSRKYLRVWSDGEYLIAGEYEHTTLNILTADCETLHTHKLCDTTEADYIDSGAHIRGNLHAVIVYKNGSVDTFKLHLVHIDPRRRQIQIIRRQLDVIRPVRVVSMDSARFAVLGWGRIEEPQYISIHNKDDFSEINHINICYGAVYTTDCITLSPAGGWCVSSWGRHCVYQLTSDGVNTGTVATAARDERDVRPGFIWYPYHMHHDSQGALVIVTVEGQIHRKRHNKDWEIVAETKQIGGTAVWDVCFLRDHMYTMYQDKITKFKLHQTP